MSTQAIIIKERSATFRTPKINRNMRLKTAQADRRIIQGKFYKSSALGDIIRNTRKSENQIMAEIKRKDCQMESNPVLRGYLKKCLLCDEG